MKTKLFAMLFCGAMCASFCACEKNESETLPEFVNVPTGTIASHEYVDLGLPSGTLWATCNIGATSPELSGHFFAWGERKAKSIFQEGNYEHYDKSNKVLKYCINDNDGTVDNKKVLEGIDDAATMNWSWTNIEIIEKDTITIINGDTIETIDKDTITIIDGNTIKVELSDSSNIEGAWRMPTDSDFDEIEMYCSWTWATFKGVTGYQVQGPNGNSIFIPCTCNNDGSYFWSSSLCDSRHAYSRFFHIDKRFACNDPRHYGRLVRPVYLP